MYSFSRSAIRAILGIHSLNLLQVSRALALWSASGLPRQENHKKAQSSHNGSGKQQCSRGFPLSLPIHVYRATVQYSRKQNATFSVRFPRAQAPHVRHNGDRPTVHLGREARHSAPETQAGCGERNMLPPRLLRPVQQASRLERNTQSLQERIVYLSQEPLVLFGWLADAIEGCDQDDAHDSLQPQ